MGAKPAQLAPASLRLGKRRQAGPPRPAKAGRSALLLASSLLVAFSITFSASFFVEDLVGQWRANESFSQALSASTGYDRGDVERIRRNAESYNRGIAGMQAGNLDSYEEQLDLEGDDVLCWLDVPALDLKIPVYRDSADEEESSRRLMSGAVHMMGTSLPVGGQSTHCAITAHSGMRNARMFDEIDKLAPGDRFTLWVMGEPEVYEVDCQKTIEPDDTGCLGTEDGKDLCTLVTCRPIGVNTHRLLVQAHRVEGAPPASGLPRTSDMVSSPRTLLFVGALALATVVLWMAVTALARRARRGKHRGAGRRAGLGGRPERRAPRPPTALWNENRGNGYEDSAR